MPYILAGVGEYGLLNALKMTNDQSGLPAWAKRCHRAHMNMIENLAPFAALVLVLNLSGKADSATIITCSVFVLARFAHVLIYILGIPYLRTASFTIGWAACVYLFWQAMT